MGSSSLSQPPQSPCWESQSTAQTWAYYLFLLFTVFTLLLLFLLAARRRLFPIRQRQPWMLVITTLCYWFLVSEVLLRLAIGTNDFPCVIAIFASHISIGPLFGCYFMRIVRLHIIFSLDRKKTSFAKGTFDAVASTFSRSFNK